MSITIDEQGGKFVLLSFGEPCGPRLRKGDPWPLRSGRPFDYDTLGEAQEAALKLEKYLNSYLVKKKK